MFLMDSSMDLEESRETPGGVTVVRDRVMRDTETTEAAMTETGIIMVIIMTEDEATEVVDGAEEEEDSEAAEVIGEVESLYREAGLSPTLPRVVTFSLRKRTTEAGAEVEQGSTIFTRDSCSNTDQVRVRVMRRIRWSMAGGQGQDQGHDQDH